jgi:hypothetical protein
LARKPKLSGSQYRKIRDIRARGLSPAYEARLIRGVQQGKTQQQSRGHRPGEARQRAEYQRQMNEGLSNSEDVSVRNWYNKHFNPRGSDKIPTEDDVVEFARAQGIADFREYQKTWNAARRAYVRELKAGTWASRGLGYLETLTEMARVRPTGGIEWLYYH